MLAALLGNVTKSNDEVLDIAVTSNWNEGIYTDTKQAYRKIMGTVLFADKDGDGVSRYTSYIFISNKADGNWQQLKFKAFNASIEGWAEPRKGDLGSPAGKGFIGTLMWLLLAGCQPYTFAIEVTGHGEDNQTATAFFNGDRPGCNGCGYSRFYSVCPQPTAILWDHTSVISCAHGRIARA